VWIACGYLEIHLPWRNHGNHGALDRAAAARGCGSETNCVACITPSPIGVGI
jgi:hypothetical protein